MNRRIFLSAMLAGIGLTLAPSCAVAAPFQPTRFTVEIRGTGPDVLLIPGLSSGRDVWNGLVAQVPGYRYHLIQVSGFVGTPVRGNKEGAVLAPLADEIGRYISENRIERPALIGHSMGGTLSMMVGARRPGQVGRIMVVDMLPQPAGLFGGNAGGMGSLLNNLIASPGGRQLVGSLMTAFAPPGASQRRSDPDLVARATHELARTDLTRDLGRIQAPMTVVYASAGGEAGAATARSFTSAYVGAPRARLVPVEGAGHMVMLDQPRRFAAVAREFLARR